MPYEDGEFYPDETTPSAALAFTIRDIRIDEILGAVVNRVVDQLRKKIDAEIERQVSDAVAVIVRDSVADRVSGVVGQILDEGFQKTNSWGQPTGDKLTLRALIQQILTENESHYGKFSISKIVSEEVRKRFDQVATHAVNEFRANLDTELLGRVNEALRKAVGVR